MTETHARGEKTWPALRPLFIIPRSTLQPRIIFDSSISNLKNLDFFTYICLASCKRRYSASKSFFLLKLCVDSKVLKWNRTMNSEPRVKWKVPGGSWRYMYSRLEKRKKTENHRAIEISITLYLWVRKIVALVHPYPIKESVLAK